VIENKPLSASAGVVATEGSVEHLREKMAEVERQVEELSPEGDAARFESLLSEAFRGEL
jgi:hypothetical protein